MPTSLTSAEIEAAVRAWPTHERCTVHRRYKLSCEQYEELLDRSGNICEMCRRPLARGPRNHLAIDHCGPMWAVRGLLCNGCNAGLGDDNYTYRNAKEYLANAWWERRCAAIGVPLTLRPEPPIGSAIRNQFGVVWVHLSENEWYGSTRDVYGNSWKYWSALFDLYGPHNLVSYNLRAAYRDGSMPSNLRYTVENGRDWGSIRTIVGAPKPQARLSNKGRPRGDSPPWLETPEQTVAALRGFVTPEECRRIGELLLEDTRAASPNARDVA